MKYVQPEMIIENIEANDVITSSSEFSVSVDNESKEIIYKTKAEDIFGSLFK